MSRDVTGLLADFGAGRCSPVDAVDESLSSLDGLGTDLNVSICVLADQARAAARAAAARWADGTARPLEGVPLGLKDIIAVADVPMSAGSRVLEGYLPRADAAVVERLRAAGAVIVAKLATFAFANGDPVNADYGATRNPADPARLAGGSSSGSAAAVGAGCVPLAIGSDTGGSIRLPAAYCGVAGIKPSFGRVSRHGVFPLAWTLDHVGPFATSVRDLRLVLQVVAGPDERDRATTLPLPAVPSGTPPYRVGVPRNHFTERLDTITSRAFERALAGMERAGARLVEVDVPDAELFEPVGRTIITAEAASLHEPLADRLEDYDDLLGARLAAASLVRATDYLKALRLRDRLARGLATAFERCDVLASPTTPTVAPLVDDLLVDQPGGSVPWLDVAARNTFPFNLTGQPTVSVPIGGTPLPVGLQLTGRLGADALVLDAAEWFERLGA